MSVLCIYHGNCADGFAAAVAVKKAFDVNSAPVEFHAGVYQDPPPDVTGKGVILVDFSYKRPVLLEMAEKASSVLILDHHKSAEAELVDLPDNVTTVFDMERSGCMITWDYFFPAQEAPKLLQHIQDRDLWKFELEGTKEIQAALFSYPYDFEMWLDLIQRPSVVEELYSDGVAIERKHMKDVKELIASAAHRMVIDGHDVPVLNAPYLFSSDAGNIMAQGESFAACYWDTPKGITFSLRSAEDGMDVSEIAARFGGGGHKHAAGYRIAR